MKRILVCLLPFVVAACGGGGGGGGAGGAGGGGGYLRSEVPYQTPVRVATIDPLTKVDGATPVFDTFNANITGSGADIIIAGRQTQPANQTTWSTSKISMLSWQNGTLVDKTAQWFPGGINEILGTEPSVKFADFFKTGRTDMFVAPSTDMDYYGPAYVFANQGTQFSRISIPLNNVWAHDSAVGDVNGDTYPDIILTDYGPNTTLAINNKVNGFTPYIDSRGRAGDLRWGGSSVTMGDFLQNGSTQFVVTDNACNTTNPSCSDARVNKLYGYTIDGSNNLNFNYISDLPTARFDLPKWASFGFNSHNVRAVTYDFNDDGVPDVIIFSRPFGNWSVNKYSEIQFLKNNGGGNFSDVTDTVLVNYNTNTYSTYNPRFIDINGDGKLDILVSGADYSGNNNSTQILLKSNDGKYVAAYQKIFTDFIKQTNDMTPYMGDGNTVNIFKAPNGKLYLLTMVAHQPTDDRKLAVFMSELGSQSVTTAQTAVALIQQKWPYMSAAQANEMLAKTSANYAGGYVIDLENALSPIGGLAINGRTVSGYIAGLNFGSGQAVATDSLQRPFAIDMSRMSIARLNAFNVNTEQLDQFDLTSHAEYLVNGTVTNLDGVRVGNEEQTAKNVLPGTLSPTQYTIGVPNLYRKGDFSYGMQFTRLNNNPWIAFGGSWGTVTGSNVLDNVVGYKSGGFSARASLMYVTTTITPGLITSVAPMYGAWAETGYKWKMDHNQDVGVYAGVKPVVLSSQIQANIPTNIDSSGNLVYTKSKLSVVNHASTYLRALFSQDLTKHAQWRVSGMVTSDSQYRVMNEFRWIWR
jgi:hypothetical protein